MNWPVFPWGGFVEAVNAADTTNTRLGISLNGDGVSGTYGTNVEIIASTASDYVALIVCATNRLITSHQPRVRINIGASGGFELVPDLMLTRNSYADPGPSMKTWFLPVAVPAGSRLSAQCSNQGNASESANINVWGVTASALTPVGHKGIESIGYAGGSLGTAIDPGGTANTKGSWVELTSATTDDIVAVLPQFNNNNNGTATDATWLVDLAIGASSSEQIVAANLYCNVDGVQDVMNGGLYPWLPCAIPAGTRVSARAQCSITDATDRLIDVVVLGLNP